MTLIPQYKKGRSYALFLHLGCWNNTDLTKLVRKAFNEVEDNVKRLSEMGLIVDDA